MIRTPDGAAERLDGLKDNARCMWSRSGCTLARRPGGFGEAEVANDVRGVLEFEYSSGELSGRRRGRGE